MQQYMAPCRHFMAVIKDPIHLTTDLFHIRWWKHYNYYFASDMGTDIVFNVHRSLVTLQNEMFEKSFHNGVYKGSYMGRNEFIKKEHTIDDNSKAAFVMEAMLQYTLEKGPILKGDNSFLQFLPGNTSMDVHDEINEFGFGLNDHFIDDIQGGMQITATEEFGHGTATTGFLSQNSIGYENFLSTENNAHEKGDDLWNLVQSTMSTISHANITC